MLGEPWILIARWFQSAESGSAVLQQPPEGKVKKYWIPLQTHLETHIYTLFSLLAGRPWTSLKGRAVWWCLACRDTHRAKEIEAIPLQLEMLVLEVEEFSDLMCFFKRVSQFCCSHLGGGSMWRTAAVVVLYSLGRAKQTSSCWEVHANPLSSYLPLFYRPFPIRCDLWDSHKAGEPSAVCSK